MSDFLRNEYCRVCGLEPNSDFILYDYTQWLEGLMKRLEVKEDDIKKLVNQEIEDNN